MLAKALPCSLLLPANRLHLTSHCPLFPLLVPRAYLARIQPTFIDIDKVFVADTYS